MSLPQNHLIELLPEPDRARLLAQCHPAELVLEQVLSESGQATTDVYFPVDAFISLIARVDEHAGLEVGMVGREGMLGIQLTLGVPDEPLHAVVQGAGMAWRLDAASFKRELARSATLRGVLARYLYVLMAQRASAAACLRFHLISPRLARWLLMSQDRAHADKFFVTQEFLGYMLGVRRVGVTVAAGGLQRAELITYRRGELTVLDRSGLEAAACSCYEAERRLYQRWVF